MGIHVADEPYDASRGHDGHIFFDAVFTADIDDHRIAPRPIVAGNDRTGPHIELTVGSFKIQKLAIPLIFGQDFIIIDAAFL